MMDKCWVFKSFEATLWTFYIPTLWSGLELIIGIVILKSEYSFNTLRPPMPTPQENKVLLRDHGA